MVGTKTVQQEHDLSPAISVKPRSELIRRLSRGSEGRAVEICLWKDRETFPQLIGFDLDALVRVRRWAVVEKFIGEGCFEVDWRIIMTVRRGNLMTCFLAANRAQPGMDDDFLQVDLHKYLTVRGAPYLPGKLLWASATRDDGVLWINPIYSAVISYLEPLIGGNYVKERYVSELAAVKRQYPEEVANIMRTALGERGASEVLTSGTRADASMLYRALIRKALKTRLREMVRVIWGKARDFAISYVEPPGTVWAFCGPDGGGKTTIIDHLIPMVVRRTASGAKIFHTRPYLLPRISSVLPIKASTRDRIQRERKYEHRIGYLKSAIRLIYMLLDYQLGYWLKVRPRLARGEMVLFDRYYPDVLVDPLLRGINLPVRVMEKCRCLVPRVHRTIFVIASGGTVARRKSDLCSRDGALQVERYLAVAEKSGQHDIISTELSAPNELAMLLARQLLADLNRRREI